MAFRTDYTSAAHTRIWEHLNDLGTAGNAHVLASTPLVQQGSVQIVPTAADTPTSVAVTYPEPFGEVVRPQVTVNTTLPGTAVKGISATSATSTGFIAWLTRSNTTSTAVTWLAVGKRVGA